MRIENIAIYRCAILCPFSVWHKYQAIRLREHIATVHIVESVCVFIVQWMSLSVCVCVSAREWSVKIHVPFELAEMFQSYGNSFMHLLIEQQLKFIWNATKMMYCNDVSIRIIQCLPTAPKTKHSEKRAVLFIL